MPGYPVKGKSHLARKVEELLMHGNCAVFEKIDGANTGIYRSKGQTYLQKKGSNVDMSHPQFSFFQNEWFFANKEKIDNLPDNIVVYGELMRCVHTINYDSLPDWFLVFDIFDLKENKFMEWYKVEQICRDVGLHTVPLLYKGKIESKDQLLGMVPRESAFGDIAEGIVVKNYRQQVMGKYVKAEFLKSIDTSGFWKNKKIVLNKVI